MNCTLKFAKISNIKFLILLLKRTCFQTVEIAEENVSAFVNLQTFYETFMVLYILYNGDIKHKTENKSFKVKIHIFISNNFLLVPVQL